jgi:hypothetical protein
MLELMVPVWSFFAPSLCCTPLLCGSLWGVLVEIGRGNGDTGGLNVESKACIVVAILDLAENLFAKMALVNRDWKVDDVVVPGKFWLAVFIVKFDFEDAVVKNLEPIGVTNIVFLVPICVVDRETKVFSLVFERKRLLW